MSKCRKDWIAVGIEGGLGLIGKRPWGKWIGGVNTFATWMICALIVLSGAVMLLMPASKGSPGIVRTLVRALTDDVGATLGTLSFVSFMAYLSPKALALVRSLSDREREMSIRPELMYILRAVFGFGSFLLGAFALVSSAWDAVVPAVLLFLFGLLAAIFLTQPNLVKFRIGTPQSALDELLALVVLPIRIVLMFLPVILVFGAFYGVVVSVECAGEASEMPFSLDLLVHLAGILGGCVMTILCGVLIPLAVYVVYLVILFVTDVLYALVDRGRVLEKAMRLSETHVRLA